MATLAKLVVKLITDVTEFSKGMDTAVQKYNKIGQSMQGIGDKMSMKLTLPLVAAGGAAIKFASDLEETKNKAIVVFSDMSDAMLDWSSNSATALGMSQQETLDYASTFGSLLKNMGLGTEEVYRMSASLTTMTADYASFHNLNPGEAFEKIKAGLVGSSEPLLSLGKDLRQGAVEAYAMANGMEKVNGKLSNQNLALARYGALIEQSAQEFGDRAKTADQFAGSVRTVTAEFKDLMASFGQELLPVATDFMRALVPILGWFSDLPQPVKQGAVYFLMFAAALGPIMSIGGRFLQLGTKIKGVMGIKGLLGTFTKLVPLTISAGGATGSLGAALATAALPALGLIAAIGLLIVVIKRFGPEAWNSIKMLGFIIGKFLVETVGGGLVNVTNLFLNWLKSLPINISGFGKNFAVAGRNLMIGFVNGIKSMAASLIDAVLHPILIIINQVRAALGLNNIAIPSVDVNRRRPGEAPSGYAEPPVRNGYESTSSTLPAGIKSGGTSDISVEFKEITINGDLSESTKKNLRVEIKDIFTSEFKAILDGA